MSPSYLTDVVYPSLPQQNAVADRENRLSRILIRYIPNRR
ncbi:hypothetical protein J28TS4_14990 [Paenibacillus lautus]|nr:hypothetical protein J28TS4_14990 [Paenibacillus lautus]